MLGFLQLGEGSGIARLSTTTGDGASDVFVDMNQVPLGMVRVIQSVFLLPDSINTAGDNIAVFVCDQTDGPNSSPLGNNKRLDIQKVGAIVGDGTSTPTIINQITDFTFYMAPGQFLRFATAAGAIPNAGDFFDIRVHYSDIPIC